MVYRCLWLILVVAWLPAVASAARAEEADHRDEARQAVEQVLADRRFRGLDPSVRGDSWLWQKMHSALQTIVDFMGSLPLWLVWILVIWMVLALLAIFVHFLWTIDLFRRVRRRTTVDAAAPLSAKGERLPDEQEMILEAEALMAKHDYAAASRALLLALLLRLARGRWIRFDRDVTNGRALRQVPADFPLRDGLEPAIHRMDAVTYGNDPADEPLCQFLKSLVERVPVAPSST